MKTQAALKFSLDHELDYMRMAMVLMRDQPATFLSICSINLDKFAADFLKADHECFLSLAKMQIAELRRARDILQLMIADNWIAAIKMLREDTGLGLMDAKNVICALKYNLQRTGKLPAVAGAPGSSLNPQPVLDAQLQNTHDALLGAA